MPVIITPQALGWHLHSRQLSETTTCIMCISHVWTSECIDMRGHVPITSTLDTALQPPESNAKRFRDSLIAAAAAAVFLQSGGWRGAGRHLLHARHRRVR